MRFAARARASIALLALTVAACSGSSSVNGTSAPPDAGDDAAAAGDDASIATIDSAVDGATDDGASPGCGEFAGDPVFTCSKDGSSRGKCEGDASASVEACPRGCLREKPPADSVCMGTTDTWSCTGSYGTTRSDSGDYYISSFGCWIDAAGTEHTDPGDNCIPSCFAQAQKAGLCLPGETGKQCEERVNWFTADGARFGCLQRLRVTNPLNGKSLIAVALDFGPACTGEAKVSHEVLDSSGRLDEYLFGTQHGGVDRALIHVVEVDDATPLGPIP